MTENARALARLELPWRPGIDVPRVLNIRAGSPYRPRHGEPFVFVGRPSPYGNPFHCGNRATNVRLYEEWLMAPERALLRERMYVELRKKSLACFCYPKPCHASAILRLLEQRFQRLEP